MSRKKKKPKRRCAIDTRKSTTEGLDGEITSLDVQRQAAEACIRSQSGEGWRCLPRRYDDGGYSGADTNRPALQRLLADVTAGKLDCVVVYKVDRLGRSLLDFARLVDLFERHGVSFVAVTQQLNTSHSMGRLTLNVLLSFAQFERELIAERTRDRLAAARRRGKWTGGVPPLGYDLVDSRLVVNTQEAERVRAIFALYLKTGSLSRAVSELDRRGWRNKAWVTRRAKGRGGGPFRKSTLHRLLANVTYLGKVRHKSEVYAGQQEAVVDEAVFEQVKQQLANNRPSASLRRRHRHEALLERRVHCAVCASLMEHHYTANGMRRYRYYVCRRAQRDGRHACPCPALPALELEQFVVRSVAGQENGDALTPRAQRELTRRVVQRVEYDGASDEFMIELRGSESRTSRAKVHFRRDRADHKEIYCTSQPENGSPSAQGAPRVARLMALSLRFEALVRDGQVNNYAQLARLGRVSRARLSQVMSLALWAPDIQEALLFQPAGTRPFSERQLRPLAAEPDWTRQRQLWSRLQASHA